MSQQTASADIERCRALMDWHGGAVFVFGSNLRGIHGKGAAREALSRYGAQSGIGEGAIGRSYALPTKLNHWGRGLPLWEIGMNVARFLDYARQHPETPFVVTRIECGYAGYTDADIAPLFKDAPPNCHLPEGWQ